MARITAFEDVEDLLDHLNHQRDVADSHVEAWQAALKPGDFFVRLIPESEGIVAVYGEVLDPEAESDPESIYNEPHMKHIRFTQCFSMLCPSGELGDTHVASMGRKLSKTQFNLAAEMGWPSDARVRRIVGMD